MNFSASGHIGTTSESADHLHLLWCRDTPRGCALLFASGLELEIFVNDYCCYARWWLPDGVPIAIVLGSGVTGVYCVELAPAGRGGCRRQPLELGEASGLGAGTPSYHLHVVANDDLASLDHEAVQCKLALEA